MTAVIWSKFYWSDWTSDPSLKLCSLAAQGLWVRMLALAAQHDPIGYVCLAGRPLGVTDLARLTGASETEVAILLEELDRNGVFSRDRQQRIYSRRMVKDARLSAIAKKNGKLGGNPSLGKDSGNTPPDNPQDKAGHNTQEPRTSSKVRERIDRSPNLTERGRADERPDGASSRRAWSGPQDFREAVVSLRGEDFAASWLDLTAWQDVPERAVICRLGITARRLSTDLRKLLKDHGIAVKTEQAA